MNIHFPLLSRPQAAEAEQLAAHIAALGSTATRLEALKAERARLEPLTGEVAVLEEQLKELRQLESTKAALQVSWACGGRDRGLVRWAAAARSGHHSCAVHCTHRGRCTAYASFNLVIVQRIR